MSSASLSGELSNLRIVLGFSKFVTGVRSKGGPMGHAPSNSAPIFKITEHTLSQNLKDYKIFNNIFSKHNN